MNDNTFRMVYQKYHRLIYQSVMIQTQNQELADDICQQTFLKYFEYMETVTPGFEKGWLLTVAKNLLIDYYRKRKHMPVDEAQISEACQEKVYEEDPAQEMIRKNFLSQILYELEQKNKEWYDAVLEVCILNIPMAEAAKHQNISIDLLRTRVYRGRQYLKKLFGEEYKNLET